MSDVKLDVERILECYGGWLDDVEELSAWGEPEFEDELTVPSDEEMKQLTLPW